MNATLGTDLADRWVCGAFQPATGPHLKPYRCTDPHDHRGHHRAILDGTLLAEWPRRSTHPEPPTH